MAAAEYPEKCLLQRRCVFLSAPPVEDVPCGSHVFIWRLCWRSIPRRRCQFFSQHADQGGDQRNDHWPNKNPDESKGLKPAQQREQQ